jgi:hypothetical protein
MNCSNASSYKYIGDNIELLSLDRMWSSSDQGPCSSETARWFAELMAAGIPFPPIGVVLFVGDRFHVIDGAHRVGTSKLSVVTARGASKFACRLA